MSASLLEPSHLISPHGSDISRAPHDSWPIRGPFLLIFYSQVTRKAGPASNSNIVIKCNYNYRIIFSSDSEAMGFLLQITMSCPCALSRQVAAPAPGTQHQRQQPVSATCAVSSQHHSTTYAQPAHSTSAGAQRPAPAPAPATCLHHVRSQLTAGPTPTPSTWRWCCELAVHVCRCWWLLVLPGAGAGAGAVSWLCAWWKQVAGAGGGCRRWCCELAVCVVGAGCWWWVPGLPGGGAGAGAVGAGCGAGAGWCELGVCVCVWWKQGPVPGAGAGCGAGAGWCELLCCLRACVCAHKLRRARSYVVVPTYSPNRDSYGLLAANKNELAARAFERGCCGELAERV